MGKSKNTVISYRDPTQNHKESSVEVKNLLIQVKALGLVGKHAGSKPIARLKSSLRRANKQLAILSKITKILNKQEEPALIAE